jgi:hypothetical protein
MELVGVSGYTVQYRVRCKDRAGYLSWISGWNDETKLGYAGIYGAAVDRVQCRVVKR